MAVFVPGVASGSPIYEMLVAGAQKAVAESPGASIKVIEGGYDQSTWLDKLRDIAASGEFGLIVTSNPALPELCAKVAADYPEQRFFVADAYMAGNPSMHTVLYNQKEQGYIVGYLAGLVSKAAMPTARWLRASSPRSVIPPSTGSSSPVSRPVLRPSIPPSGWNTGK